MSSWEKNITNTHILVYLILARAHDDLAMIILQLSSRNRTREIKELDLRSHSWDRTAVQAQVFCVVCVVHISHHFCVVCGETGSGYVIPVHVEIVSPLPQPLKGWDHKCVAPQL